MVCGFGDAISYDQLVQKVTGKHIDKSSRFTDWRRRPLSDKQLDYALADVTYLRDIYLYLKQELEKEGRSEWVNEEMAVLTSRETYDLHPDDAWRRVKARVRKPIEQAIRSGRGSMARTRSARTQCAARTHHQGRHDSRNRAAAAA
jgi:ribonuclease D